MPENPADLPFARTAIEPQGQSRRRHIRTEGRTVVGVDDDLLDGSAGDDLVGEGALLAALEERRTGRMGTAVATLQREQDDIVRAGARGALVVQGGPGTGKTVVALHRVAYLLFAHPQLARGGSSSSSRRSASSTTSVRSCRPRGECRGLRHLRDAAAGCPSGAKGEPRPRRDQGPGPVAGGAGAARRRAGAPAADLRLRWDDEEYIVPSGTVERLQRAALSGRGYHPARRIFTAHLVDVLTELVTDRVVELRSRIEADPAVELGLLLGDPAALAEVAPALGEEDGARPQGDFLVDRVAHDRQALSRLLDHRRR